MKLIKFSLEACRKNVGMNLKDASGYVGINYQTLSKYEHDSSHLDTNRYSKVGLFHSQFLTSRNSKAKPGFGEPC
ncbi:XRE family transcriptional regulator, partial [Levilactobacillus brevis]|nr:XRE family transcriptional regulator [Levilactobacillus brevis]